MALFAASGALHQRKELAGRANDPRPKWLVDDAADPAPGIKLEYKDELGRELTPKEAYRRISYAFHGRDPSKTVRDKRLKAMAREQGLAGAGSSDTPLGVVNALRRAQEAQGAAHIVLGKGTQ